MKPRSIQWEPERYELFSAPLHTFEANRREFFQTLGGGILIAALFTRSPAEAQESGGGRGRGFGGQRAPQDVGAWLHIDGQGAVTVFTGKVEVGQNARTSLSMAVAEELGAPLSSVEVVMGDTDRTPFDNGTVGSQTTPTMVPQLRRAAAAARQALLEIAAAKWNLPAAQLRTAGGNVTDGQRSIAFGELARDQQIYKKVATSAEFKPTAAWTVMGKSTPKINGRAMVTGAHQYTSDMKRPGMLYGRVLRPPSFGATLVSFDSKAAAAMPGVTVVRDGDFAGVAAPTPSAAAAALASLKAEWKSVPQTSAKTLFTDLKGSGQGAPNGPLEKAMAEAHHKAEQTYTVAYIAHTPLEPRAALAFWEGEKVQVWTGTQRPFGVRSELSQAFRIPEENVRVMMPDTGSGYGGKHTGDAAVEAARLARAAGKPVKVTWTREEEFTWAYFRPAGVIDIRAGMDHEGRVTAWEFHNYNSGNSGMNTYYDVAAKNQVFHNVKSPLRQGSYRGLAATANHFAREVHMDELAAMAGTDPLEFRLRNLKDDRVKAVLQAAAEKFGWGKRKAPAGTGYGIAAGFEKGGYVASCVEVQAQPGRAPRVARVVEAFECGAIVNPDHLQTQIEGAIMMGIGGALFEAIDFSEGKILNPHLAQYRVPRFRDMPEIQVVLVDRKDLPPAGAGETPIVTVAPSIANAIFMATGERHRSLPMFREA